MAETLNFHFEGALADAHRMNFYESARFQYAAARLMVKLSQFRQSGRFVKNITNNSNYEIQLTSQSAGSFNINIEGPTQGYDETSFIKIPLSDLIAYVSERIVEKIDEKALSDVASTDLAQRSGGSSSGASISPSAAQLVDSMVRDGVLTAGLSPEVQDLVKRRASERYRESRLAENQQAISRIDFARSQKLIAMSAPLISEMATALRRSANTLGLVDKA